MSSDVGLKLRDDSADGVTYITTTTSGSSWNPINLTWTLNDSGLNSSKRDKYFKKILEENNGK